MVVAHRESSRKGALPSARLLGSEQGVAARASTASTRPFARGMPEATSRVAILTVVVLAIGIVLLAMTLGKTPSTKTGQTSDVRSQPGTGSEGKGNTQGQLKTDKQSHGSLTATDDSSHVEGGDNPEQPGDVATEGSPPAMVAGHNDGDGLIEVVLLPDSALDFEEADLSPSSTVITNDRDLEVNKVESSYLKPKALREVLMTNPTYSNKYKRPAKNAKFQGATEAVPSLVVQATTPFLDEDVDADGSIFAMRQGFVGTCTHAYNKHHHLQLRADDVWQAIVTQFSLYVMGNAAELRDTFVDFQGKKELVISAAGTLFTADFGRMARRMVDEQIVKNIKDPSIAAWLIPDFTTTRESDRIAASVSVMAGLQKYFDFKFSLSCGLPSVTQEGSLADWVRLRKRIDRLVDFDVKGQQTMRKWHALLAPVLDEFIRTKRGEDNMASFWEFICHREGGGSGPSYLSGWITAFTAFNEEGKWQADAYTRSTMMGEVVSKWPLIDTQDIASGVVAVPVLIDDNGTEYDGMLFSGQFAFSAPTPTTVKPRTDWCIAIEDKRKQES